MMSGAPADAGGLGREREIAALGEGRDEPIPILGRDLVWHGTPPGCYGIGVMETKDGIAMKQVRPSRPPGLRRLHRAELPVDTLALARYLIGKTLVHDLPAGRLSGRIVETEGYPPGDAAGHAYRGQTKANRSLFLGRGRCYVYFTYGSSFMMNVTSEAPGIGAGVLLRALEPIDGVAMMKRLRRTERVLDLARGPGRLAAAMRIDKRCDSIDLCAPGPLWLGTATRATGRIGNSVRIGLTREVERKRRFYERGNPYVSGPPRLRV
jgi:DNA-3-methyladenine glycosylase